MRLRILSRASDLARLQALMVGQALQAHDPALTIEYLTRSSLGDRDVVTPLDTLSDKGAFTADLSDALGSGAADLVVHSWKDLPLEGRPHTEIIATLERADPRDVLIARQDAVRARPDTLRILSSSPRRRWLIDPVLADLLPWRPSRIEWLQVRGNIATRLARLSEGRGDALLVAKAALDRLLGFGAPFEAAGAAIRSLLANTQWMVLPIREVPSAPAQGALAVEISARASGELRSRLTAMSHAPTWHAVMAERALLASYGGGCHQAMGATAIERDFGRITSLRAKNHANSGRDERWTLERATSVPPPRAVSAEHVWPRPDERRTASPPRRPLDVADPADGRGLFIARADALPSSWSIPLDGSRLVWAAGGTTWRRLAARGIWVHGSAEGLGDDHPAVNDLAGRDVQWLRLTHAGVREPGAVATYAVDEVWPADLPSRTHFFWTSGTAFRKALERWPDLARRSHASGPGRTARTLTEVLGPAEHARVWLDYDQWLQEVMP